MAPNSTRVSYIQGNMTVSYRLYMIVDNTAIDEYVDGMINIG